ncbi:hypothetical protein LAJ19_19950 (plasmid) [Deinococcus taeanensis]|uniref:hypothetical protein n=1 Tax=Deinococcus taeanensis TaxID=2737050 RepID=UPI001CDC49A1|nr:hypothetical protein [Deinococcus taeanensis]UBV45407.1 hypothetical protein LAJ19_19950 [Deinococcus taeanensis]
MTVQELQELAAQGVAEWQPGMPRDVTLGAEVPEVDSVFFTVVRGDQGAFVQVPAWEMTDPASWESAAARLLALIQDDRLLPLDEGRVPLVRWIVPPRVPQSGAGPAQYVDLEVLLPDDRVRWAVAAALEHQDAHLELHGELAWFAEPTSGSLVPVTELSYDEELGLVDRRAFPAEHV